MHFLATQLHLVLKSMKYLRFWDQLHKHHAQVHMQFYHESTTINIFTFLITLYYELNVCVCSKFMHWNLTPDEVVLKGQALGDTRCWEWSLMIRISVLIKEVPESCLALLLCDGRRLQLWEKQSLTGAPCAGTLVLDSSASRAVRTSFLVSISSVCGILW